MLTQAEIDAMLRGDDWYCPGHIVSEDDDWYPGQAGQLVHCDGCTRVRKDT